MNETQSYALKAHKRIIIGKKVKKLRREGLIPAVIYGHKAKPENIAIDKSEFEKVFAQAGTSALVELSIEGKDKFKVLTHEPQLDPVRDNPLHVDFYRVRMDEKIKTEIPLEFTGESLAVEQLDGSLVTNRDAIEIECLPNDLVPEIKVDISTLKTFDDTILVKNLPVPPGIEILTEPEETIALVEPPRSEEEIAELEESAAEKEKEAIEKIEGETESEKPDAQEGDETPGEETDKDKQGEQNPGQ